MAVTENLPRGAASALAAPLLLALLAAGCGLPLPFGGSEKEVVEGYGAYRRALASRDRGALRATLAEERAGEVDDPFAPYRQYSEARSLPSTVTVLGVERSGEEATLRLRAGSAVLLRKGARTPAFPPLSEASRSFPAGTVRLVRQGGAWRVSAERWAAEAGRAGTAPLPLLKGGALPAAAVTLAGHVDEVSGIAFAAGGRIVSAGYGDRTLRLWDEGTGAPLAVEAVEDPPRALAVTPDGRAAVTADDEGRVSMRDILPGGFGPPVQLPGSAGRRPQLAVSADGALLAAASLDRKVTVWNLPERRRVLSLETEDPMRSVCFSPAAPLLAGGSARNALYLWDLSTGKGRRIVVPKVREESDLSGVSFRPDGGALAVAHVDGTLVLWDVATQEEGSRAAVQGSANWSVAFSPDGALFATANQGSGIHLWDGATGRPVGVLPGHGGSPRLLAFPPGGGKLASAGAGGEIVVWQ